MVHTVELLKELLAIVMLLRAFISLLAVVVEEPIAGTGAPTVPTAPAEG